MEDIEIVNLIYNRDDYGLDELRKKYNELLYNLAFNVLNNNSDSNECVNDTYLKIWKSIPPYKPTYLKSFICKIARQISIDKYRSNKRKREQETLLNELDYDISSSYSLDDEVYKNELVNYINLFLEKLDIETQVLFIRRYFLNESVKSLSKRFNIGETNISVKLLRTRNKLKIKASINNSKIFKSIQEEYGSFCNYLNSFANNKIIYEITKTTNDLSNTISKDLIKRGMKFVGSTIIYSYLQALGFIYFHDKECFKYKDK